MEIECYYGMWRQVFSVLQWCIVIHPCTFFFSLSCSSSFILYLLFRIDGRGKGVICEATIPSAVIERVSVREQVVGFEIKVKFTSHSSRLVISLSVLRLPKSFKSDFEWCPGLERQINNKFIDLLNKQRIIVPLILDMNEIFNIQSRQNYFIKPKYS